MRFLDGFAGGTIPPAHLTKPELENCIKVRTSASRPVNDPGPH